MKRIYISLFVSFVFCITNAQNLGFRQQIDISGKWQFALDADAKLSVSSALNDVVTLPGTTDTNRKGNPCIKKDETQHLSRLFSYMGKAWYRRSVTIPKDWKKRTIVMHLERTKPTTVFVDGKRAGSNNNISTEQTYDLTQWLTPGKHDITIMIDNGSDVPKQIYASSHAYTEDTQTNWNGVIGQMYLEALNQNYIENVNIATDTERNEILVEMSVKGKISAKYISRNMSLTLNDGKADIKTWNASNWQCCKIDESRGMVSITLPTKDLKMKFWSEFFPNLYTLKAELKGKDITQTTFGWRTFTAQGNHFYINGNKTFLRGKHDACVFPLTAHVPMDLNTWRRYFTILREYGINHVRCHSWCPPDAWFTIADEMGFYVQPELPFWGDFNAKDSTLMTFLRKEGENIIRKYGHHPSFVMMALGNELWGSIDEMKVFTDEFRKIDNSKLYTFGSNYYLGYQGLKPGMDYFTTCRVGGERYGDYNTHTRGSFSFADAAEGGIINHEYPNTMTTFENAIKACAAPVISHETAQFQTYPDYDEIGKYTGVLYPYNMEVFRNRLNKAGMGDMAKAFHRASGRLSAQLYKADVEMDLRTKNMAGFQLLDLQDYPGQGSAYVGILDAFMESKSIIDINDWRAFCSPVVPMLTTEKFCYTSGEKISAKVIVANYGETSLKGKTLKWSIENCSDDYFGVRNPKVMASGVFVINTDEKGVINVGEINTALNVSSADHLKTRLLIDGQTANSYDIWVYPTKEDVSKLEKKVHITTKMTDEIGKMLDNGATILFFPDSTECADNTVGGLYTTDYWNYRMFKTISTNNKKPVSPGTLGLLIDPKHPIFGDFPTDSCTSWQWFTTVKASRPMILDNMPNGYKPIVQVIDNIERNHKLGLIYELAVGRGRLLVCMADIRKDTVHPESFALYKSILRYMNSESFAPKTKMSVAEFTKTMKGSASDIEIKELRNISYE